MKLNAGAIIGLIGGLIGAIVGIASAFMAEPIIGVVITGVIGFVFFIVYKTMIKPSMEYSRLLKTGVKGTGTILSINETNTRINNQPLCNIELQVEIPGQAPFTTTTKSVISYFQASQFQPGARVPVMVDPRNTAKVILIRQGDMPADSSNALSNATPQQLEELKQKLEALQKEHDSISAVGVYCKAIVTKYVPSGINVNGNNPLVTLELQVLPDNEPAFSASTKGAIKESSIPLYQPGEEIFVKYDPNDKSRVVVEHS